jgi:membrane associated rhomboid family serine protease
MMPTVVPFTKAVKGLVIANVAVWFVLVLILQQFILHNNSVFDVLALVPVRVIHEFWVWQVFTYMFLHSTSVFHILFNMLVLWWFGAELEMRWGSRFFLKYYFVCGVGAGLIYILGTLTYYLVTGEVLSVAAPLVGASGAVYGLMLAYGMLFGDRLIYFMMLFPMKARYFVMLVGGIELVTLMDSGSSSPVSNLAHLGGLIVGYLYLKFISRQRTAKASTSSSGRRGRRLKLVVNNTEESERSPDSGPKYWN